MSKEVLVKKIEKLNRRQKILIVFLTLLIILMGYWYFFFKPASAKINKLDNKIFSLDKEINKNKKKVARLSKLREKLKSQEEIFIWAKTLLPESSSEVEKLLSQIEKLGKDVGVGFLHFAPGKERLREFYATREVSLKLNGTFHNLMNFFSQLSSLSRLVSLESLKLNPSSRKSEIVELAADIKVLVYRALTEKEVKALQKK